MRARPLLLLLVLGGCHVASGLNGFVVTDDDDGRGTGGQGGESQGGGTPSECGNGIIEPGEACDDGNRIPEDGCSANCWLDCTDGGILRESTGHCYWMLSDFWTWQQSLQWCDEVITGSYLLTITDAAERDFIDDEFVFGSNTEPWTAGNDFAVEGTFVYAGRPQDPFPEGLWANEQPNGGQQQNCVALEFLDNGNDNDLLVDRRCNDPLRTLCERDPLMP